MRDDQVVAVYPTANLDSSAMSYTVPPDAHFAALMDSEARGWTLGGVFHSHPNGSAQLSPVDVSRALDPCWLYLVVGLTPGPVVTAWYVRDGQPDEVLIVD